MKRYEWYTDESETIEDKHSVEVASDIFLNNFSQSSLSNYSTYMECIAYNYAAKWSSVDKCCFTMWASVVYTLVTLPISFYLTDL